MKSHHIFCAFLVFLAAPHELTAEVVTIPIPNQGWNVTMDAPRFAKKDGKQDGPNYIFRANSGMFNLSMFVEPQVKVGGSKDCFEHFWPRASQSPIIIQPTVKISNTDTFYRVQYMAAGEFQGEKFKQVNVNYYFEFEGKWVDVHISIINPTPADDAVVAAFDKGLKFGKN